MKFKPFTNSANKIKSVSKKLLLLSSVVLIFSNLVIAQTNFRIPDSGDAIVNIKVPTSTWSVTNEDGLFSIVPIDEGETSRLVTMIWAAEDPYSETAIDDIAVDAFDVVESLLVDVTWNEELSEFESNGISYVANDGYGYYVNEDGSKDQMSTTVMLIMPDDVNVLALVFFGIPEAYDKWEESLLEVILSMTPAK